MKDLDKKKLQELIDSVSSQVGEVLAKAEKTPDEGLAKASPGNEAPAEKVPTGSSTEGSSPEESSSASPEAPAADASSPETSSSATPDAPASDAPADGSAPQDPAQDSGGTVESLQAEYAGLPLEEIKMHLLAVKAALMTKMASEGGSPASDATPPAPAPDASASLAPAAPADAVPPPVQKSEVDPEIVARLEKLEKANKDLQVSLTEKDTIIAGFGQIAKNLQSTLETRLSGRKSAHSVSVVGRSGTELAKSEGGIDIDSLSHNQIVAKLTDLTAGNSKLSKSDKDAIAKFVASPVKDRSTIAHLLAQK